MIAAYKKVCSCQVHVYLLTKRTTIHINSKCGNEKGIPAGYGYYSYTTFRSGALYELIIYGGYCCLNRAENTESFCFQRSLPSEKNYFLLFFEAVGILVFASCT